MKKRQDGGELRPAPAHDPRTDEPLTPEARRRVYRDALGVGLATGAYGASFGAIAAASGLSTLQACVLSLLMFTGASQFALASTLAGGGGVFPAIATATLVGVRNAFYGLQLAPVLGLSGLRRLIAAHLTIDESTALATAQAGPRAARLAFWVTAVSLFAVWNLSTLAGALGAGVVDDPRDLGLDAASSAAFVALLLPRLRSRRLGALAAGGALLALAALPWAPPGVPVLIAGALAVVAGLLVADWRAAALRGEAK